METAKIIKVRTLDGCILELKKSDSETQVTKNYVRNLVLAGKVKSTRAGNKHLVNYNSLVEYLENPPEETQLVESGKLRKINV